MTIFQVAEFLKRALQKALEGNEALEINPSRVTELDTAGVQMMLVAQAEAAALGLDRNGSRGHSPPLKTPIARDELAGAKPW